MNKLLDALSLLYTKLTYRLWPSHRKQALWLIGAGRSGTTWIASLINHTNAFRELFEPFHTEIPQAQKAGFIFHQYLKQTNNNAAIEKYAQLVFKGRLYHKRVEEGTTSDPKLRSPLLVKDVFANLLVYTVCQKNKNITPVLLLRNPFAVALSKQAKQHWHWMTDPRDFLHQKDLYQDYLSPYEALINEVATKGSFIDQQLLIWAIINYIPLLQFKEDSLLVTFYEDWLLDPEHELHRLDQHTHLQFGVISSSIKKAHYSVPSRTTSKTTFNVEEWKKHISQEQYESGQKILAHFGLASLYKENGLPDHEALKLFRKQKTKHQHSVK